MKEILKEIIVEPSGAKFDNNFISGEYTEYFEFFNNDKYSNLLDRYCKIDISKGNRFKVICKASHPIDKEQIYILESEYGIHLMDNSAEEIKGFYEDIERYIFEKYGVGCKWK